jgi:site-specific recombinase XerD
LALLIIRRVSRWAGASGRAFGDRGRALAPALRRAQRAASITAAEVSSWVGSLMTCGLAPSTATRELATLRSILAFAVADARVQHNVAAAVRKPTSGRARREGQALTP